MPSSGIALCLFPTKALAHDQHNKFQSILSNVQIESSELVKSIVVYDGDTPVGQRSILRSNAKILLTNPDMLHTAILPHHTLWREFFNNLRFIVIDEVHHYRGVFGAHVSNIMRRLIRIAHFYGSFPQFIFTSASIANPVEMAQIMAGSKVELIADDGSMHGKKYLMIYNPPVIHRDLGLRKSALGEAIKLSGDILDYNLQTILFLRSRRGVETAVRLLRNEYPIKKEAIRGYRSGYLPKERREIEQGLGNNKVGLVASTSALELGIDIGSLDAALIIGYPGTIASFLQQSGRVGRRHESSLSMMMASANPIDQFLTKHPEYLLDKDPEHVFLNPNNPLILLNHLRCAVFELPFSKNELFGDVREDLLNQYLELINQIGDVYQSGEKYYWVGMTYPAESISIRTSGAQTVAMQLVNDDGKTSSLAIIDEASVYWMAHPGAIYIHEGTPYQVMELRLDEHLAYLKNVNEDYETEAIQHSKVNKISENIHSTVNNGDIFTGEILVESQVVGFRRLRWLTREILGTEELEMPVTQLRTTGFWIAMDQSIVERLISMDLWNNRPNDYGPMWTQIRNLVRQRDGYCCQICGVIESTGVVHDVHHKIPFRSFQSSADANRMNNLITLCKVCHQRVEQNVRFRSGLAGMAYIFQQLAPMFLMCDPGDLGVFAEPDSAFCDGKPVLVVYDQVPGGIGLSENIFTIYHQVIHAANELINSCECLDGCPSCVGPGGENGLGGKAETKAILRMLEQTAE